MTTTTREVPNDLIQAAIALGGQHLVLSWTLGCGYPGVTEDRARAQAEYNKRLEAFKSLARSFAETRP